MWRTYNIYYTNIYEMKNHVCCEFIIIIIIIITYILTVSMELFIVACILVL